MTNFFKNLAVILGVLIISSGIFYLVSEDGEVNHDVFNRSLRLLGEELLALLPEDADSKRVQERWQEISEKATKGEIQPEQLERLAAGILNASNLERDITVQELDRFFALTLNPVSPKTTDALRLTEKPLTAVRPQKFEQLGKNLQAVCEFNRKIKNSCSEDPVRREVLIRNLRYNHDNGIRVSGDIELKKKFDHKKYAALAKEINELEKKNLIEWQHNFDMECDKQNQRLKLQLDSLRMVITSESVQIGESFKIIVGEKVSLKALEELEKLQQWHAIEPAILEQIIQESLTDIGIKTN
ncbi:hypothetical protein GWO43_25495 [candidate division KSB1 bacterium]|nr:hypothetical protein [candidate division KSB1 bacterium]NIR68950.1 hypothetical protein [candidate division KSB1 bacterium]NIS27287.1 hypothetical protein [candidate division KSB1 bacterium]NIT74166.1 hypothetical protein [candidate division KSB1 bacterium]NIU28017.1 hypothetical protein [candidate division KSB1 bacterium]